MHLILTTCIANLPTKTSIPACEEVVGAAGKKNWLIHHLIIMYTQKKT